MNFYQKMYGLISLLVIGVSAMIIFVFFESPYTRVFQIEAGAILWAELLVGLCIVHNVRKNDSLLIHAAGYTVVAVLYLLFTLGMIIVACNDILPVYFLTIHISGFTAAIILMILFFIAEHHFVEQVEAEAAIHAQKQDFRARMEEISAEANSAFAGNRDLLQSVRRLADDARFLADPSSANTANDQEIVFVMESMKQAVLSKDQVSFTEKMDRLATLFRIREKHL